MDDILYLISEEPKTQDENGVWSSQEVKTMVYCRKRDITRAEFYGAGRNGLNPSLMFYVFNGDYHGERICEFQGNRYHIYRTYTGTDDYTELYAERTAGAN